MRTLLLLLTGLLLAPAAHASIITVTFSGTISQVDPGLAASFSVDDPFSGSFQIDNTVADNLPANPGFGSFPALRNLSVVFGSYAATGSTGDVNITDDAANTHQDYFEASADSPSGADVAGHAVQSFFLFLDHADNSTFSSDAIPASLSFSDFPDSAVGRSAELLFEGPNGVFGALTSLTYTVPEPRALALLALVGCLVLL